MAARRRRQQRVKRHRRGGRWVRGYCRKRPSSRTDRSYRKVKEWGF